MSAIFKCNDGNEHDFDSNTESEYCAKGCGEKWAIYAIKKLGADLTEKDAEIEQLKSKLKVAASLIKCNETFHRLGGIDDCEPCLFLKEIES